MGKSWLNAAGIVVVSLAVLAGILFAVRSYLPQSMLPPLMRGTAAGPVFVLTADAKGLAGLKGPEGAMITPVRGADGVDAVRLSGVQSVAPSAGQPGIFVPTTATFELAASGQTVRVTVMARSAPDAPSPAFALAYSTNDVGNSGWRSFPLTSKLAAYSFTYAVPKMKSGNGDYIGILPDTSNGGGAVEVTSISAEVVPAGTAAAP